MSVTRTIAKNTLFGFVENGVDLITAFILGIVLARTLGVEKYGLYAYLIWLLSLAAIIVDLGLSEMVKRFIAEALGRGNRRQAVDLVRLTLVLRCAAAIIIGLGLALFYIYWPGMTGHANSPIFFIIIGLTIIPYGLHYAFISIFRGFQKYEYAAYVMLGTAPLRLILTSVLLITGSGLKEVLIVQIGTFGLGMIIGIYFLRRLIPLKELLIPSFPDPVLRKEALRYAMTLLGTAIIGYLASNQLSTFFIESYCPVDQVGFFRLASRLSSMPMAILTTAFSFVLTPAIAEQFGKGDTGKIKMIYVTSVRYLLMVGLPVQVGMMVLAGPMIKVLYGMNYASAVLLLQIMLIPAAIYPISQAACAVIYGTNRPGFIFKTSILFALIGIGLSLWLIPRYGAVGAAIVNSIPLGAIILSWYATKRAQVTWPVMDTVKTALASLIMGLAIFALQSRVGIILSLALGIPLGVAIYIALIFVFRAVHEEDMVILKNMQKSLPLPLRKPYIRFSGLVEKFIGKDKAHYWGTG